MSSDFAEAIVSAIPLEEKKEGMLMDHFGPLPLTIRDFEARLRQGQSFAIEGSDGMSFSLWFQEDRFFLQQGGTLHPFRQIEPAVTTLLHCLGGFGKPGE